MELRHITMHEKKSLELHAYAMIMNILYENHKDQVTKQAQTYCIPIHYYDNIWKTIENKTNHYRFSLLNLYVSVSHLKFVYSYLLYVIFSQNCINLGTFLTNLLAC
jgi:hypothetical protein